MLVDDSIKINNMFEQILRNISNLVLFLKLRIHICTLPPIIFNILEDCNRKTINLWIFGL